MKNKFFKFMSTVLVAILIISIAPMNEAVVSEMKSSANRVIKNIGKAVENIDFTLPEIAPKAAASDRFICTCSMDYRTNALTINGSGKMPNYNNKTTPWDSYRNVKSLIIKGDITNIGNSAFKNFTNLEEVVIEAPITYINASAFEGCTSLKSVTLPDTLKSIYGSVFKNCTSLKEIVIPNSVTAIYSSFAGCNLEKLITPFVGGGPDNTSETKTDQLGYMFGTTEYENTYSVKSKIDSSVYYYVPYSLKKVTVTKSINRYNFENAIGIEEIIIADTVVATGYPNRFAFGCKSLKNVVTNAEGLTGVGAEAFRCCEVLESFVIPNSVKWIGEYTFDKCYKLSSITFPAGDFYTRRFAFAETEFWNKKTEDFVIVGDGVLVRYNGTDTNVVIPEGVKRVCCAFENRSDILSIEFPDSLKYISSDSFYGCLGITELVVPDSVQKIDAGALRGMCNLKDLSIPFSGNSRDAESESTKPLFGYIFGTDSKCPICNNKNCKTDTQYYIKVNNGKDITYSFTYIFPKNLSSVTVTDNIIPKHAFRSSNVKKVILGEGVTAIEPYSFYSSSLYNIVFNNVITTLPGSSFGECTNLKTVTLTSSIKSINGAFENCIYLNTVNFVEGLESINKGFFGCKNLKTFKLPDSLKSISNKAFGNCKSIKEFYFGKGLQEISSNAFLDDRDDYRSVEAFYVDEENPYFYSLDGIMYSYDGVLIAYPENRKAESFYINKNVKKIYRNTLDQMDITKEFIVDPDNEYFAAIDGVLYNKDVTTLLRCPRQKTGDYVSPETVDEVEIFGFYKCCSLDKIEFVNDDVYFMEAAFQGVSVEELIVPNFNEKLEYYFESARFPVSYCYGEITKLKITNQKNSIDAYFASGINGLDFVEIDGTYGVICDYAFASCNFEEFTISDSVGLIGDRAFYGSDIKKLYGGSNIKKIGIYAFASTPLESFKFPETIEYIGDVAFAHTNITEVTLGDNITHIGSLAFSGSELEKAVISEKLANMSDEIFFGCYRLEIVVIGGSVEGVGEQAFANCTALETVVIPDSVVEISDNAFLDANEDLVIYCNEGSYAQAYATKNNIKYTTLVIDPIENQVYTGKEIKPDVKASANNRRLTKDTEFTVSYKDNIDAGTAKVIAKGLGDFKHLAATAQFAITPKSSENIRVISGSSSYRPKGVKPQLYVYSGATLLVEGKDFEIIENALLTDAGEYNIAVSLMGNYCGIVNITYEVSRRSVKRTNIEYGDTIKITCEGITLEEGKDYIVTKETKENGDVVTTVEGIGNYEGTDTHTEVKSNNQNSLNWFQQLIDAIRSLFEKLFNIGI